MRILLTNATDIFAGGEDYVLTLAKHLALRGHTVGVSALPGHLLLSKCADLGIMTLPLDYHGMGRVFVVSAQLRAAIIKHSIDIVHSNANYDRTCAAMATAMCSVRHVAGIHSTHSIQHNVTHWLRNRWGIDHFVTDADAGKDVLVHEDGISAGRVTTVPIGIESESPEFNHAARATARATLGADDTTPVIGNVARLVPFKGHRILLDAAARVLERVPRALFAIVGDGELLQDLQEQATRLGISDRVIFLGFRDNLHELYPAFDVYCHSSLDLASEMFPIAILRALGTALPVVATDVGGIALMVRQGISGYLVPPDNPSALADALVRILNDPRLLRSMGEASSSLFREKYHAARMAEQIERVYTQL